MRLYKQVPDEILQELLEAIEIITTLFDKAQDYRFPVHPHAQRWLEKTKEPLQMELVNRNRDIRNKDIQ